MGALDGLVSSGDVNLLDEPTRSSLLRGRAELLDNTEFGRALFEMGTRNLQDYIKVMEEARQARGVPPLSEITLEMGRQHPGVVAAYRTHDLFLEFREGQIRTSLSIIARLDTLIVDALAGR